MIDATFKPSLGSEVHGEIMDPATLALYAKFEDGTMRQLDAYFPNQQQLLAFCQETLSDIDRQIQQIVRGKRRFKRSDRACRGWCPTVDYIRNFGPDEIGNGRPVASGDRLYAFLDPNWNDPYSKLRIRLLDDHRNADSTEALGQMREIDFDVMGYTPAYTAFLEIDHEWIYIYDNVLRPFKNRKNKKLMEIRFKNLGGGKLNWNDVHTLAPYAIWRKAKTGPGRNKCNYRAAISRDEGRYALVGRHEYLDEHTVRLKLSRHEYYKVIQAIKTGGDYCFHSSPLPFLTSICKFVFAYKNPEDSYTFNHQAVINRTVGMQLRKNRS